MRAFALLLALVFAVAGGSESMLAAPAAPSPYTTANTKIGTIFADPAAKAIVAKRFPMLVKSKAVASGMANRLTLRTLKRFKPDVFTDIALAATDADFAKLPAR